MLSDVLAVTAWDARPITVHVHIRSEHARAMPVLLSAPLFTFFMNEMGAVARVLRSRPLWSRSEPGSWKTENCGGSQKYEDPRTPARFVKLSSSDVDQAIKSTENKSAIRKTAGHIKLLCQFMSENSDNREILSLRIEKLDETLSRLFLECEKTRWDWLWACNTEKPAWQLWEIS